LFLIIQMVLKDDAASIKKVALVVTIVAALETIVYIVYGASAPLGDNATLLWIGGVVIGGVIAVAAGAIVFLKNNAAMMFVGVLAVLVGAVAVRAVMWLAGSMFGPSLFDLGINSRGLFPF
jgi:hypothetical protein